MMRSLFRLLGLAAAAGLVITAAIYFPFFAGGDENKDPAFLAEACAPFTGIAGPEDLQIDPVSRRVFVSSSERRAGGQGRGGIYAFALDDPLGGDGWRDRTAGKPAAFDPIGLHYYEDATARRLFVANAALNSVELYDVTTEGDLTHIETFAERRLTSPNDVVAVGPRQFYVTNDVAPGRESLFGRLHYLLRIGSGELLYFDGTAWRSSVRGLRYANGVAVSRDAGRVYVAETAAGAVRIYDRSPSGALVQRRVARIGAPVENINVGRSGALWIAARPRPLGAGPWLRPSGRSPSLVYRYEDRDAARTRLAPVYADDGLELSASTAADRHGSTLVIGAIEGRRLLICTLPAALSMR